jgi:hypothetical protein
MTPCYVQSTIEIRSQTVVTDEQSLLAQGVLEYDHKRASTDCFTFMITGSLQGPLLDLRHPPWLEHVHDPPKYSGNWLMIHFAKHCTDTRQ